MQPKSLLKIKKQHWSMLVICGTGGMLEMYDFIICVLQAPVLSKLFFSNTNGLLSLLIAFSSFGVGYLARPIGGIIFGHLGDRHGRKKTFMLTIIIMAVATLIIGCLPTYDTLGILAPILLVILRFLQGFAVGGEIPSVITYVSEHLPKQKGAAIGVMYFFIALGIVIASLLNLLISMLTTAEQFLVFGWRILFFIGGIFGLINFIFRKNIAESPVFANLIKHENFPLLITFKINFSMILMGIILTGMGASTMTFLHLFIPTFLGNIVQVKHDLLTLAMMLASFLGACSSLFFGILTDYFKSTKLILFFGFLVMIVSMPIYHGYISGYLWLPILGGGILFGMGWGIIPNLLVSFFDAKVRCSSIGICYNLGFAIFSGLLPILVIFLLNTVKIFHIPAVILISLVLIIMTLFVIFPSNLINIHRS